MTPEKQLAGFLSKFTPAMARLAHRAHKIMHARYPHAIRMVYDNYNFLVIGFGPSERPSEAIFSIALHARGALLCFLHGAKLSDPKKLLRGAGKQVRNLRLESADVLDRPEVKALMSQAVKKSAVPFDATVKGRLLLDALAAL